MYIYMLLFIKIQPEEWYSGRRHRGGRFHLAS